MLEHEAEKERIAAEKEEARRPRAKARRSQSAPPADRDKYGGEEARGRVRQRMNEAGRRKKAGQTRCSSAAGRWWPRRTTGGALW